MTYRNFRNILLASAALILTACGGGGGGGQVNSTPRPPASPTPTPQPTPGPIVAGISTSQTFATKGATITFSSSRAPQTPTTSDSSQLHVRYDASTRQYQVQLPNSPQWQPLAANPGGPANLFTTGGSNATLVDFKQYASTGYAYSALAQWGWSRTDNLGAVAIGVATPAGGVPVTGAATYAGQIAGRSTEMVPDLLSGPWPAYIGGSISLGFNFGAGTLSGSITPTLDRFDSRSLPTLTFTNTVYSTGSTTFSGTFATNLAGPNSFSGLFTGPAAQELIGNFAFPYTSPVDGKVYQAGGGFVAKGQ